LPIWREFIGKKVFTKVNILFSFIWISLKDDFIFLLVLKIVGNPDADSILRETYLCMFKWKNNLYGYLSHVLGGNVMQSYKRLKEQMAFKTILIWKMAIASALSWELAKFFGSDHPYLAPATVIVCMQTTINRSLRYSYHRVIGVVIGVIVADIVLPYLKVTFWTLSLTILVACFISKWLKLDETTIHQTALAVVLVFVIGHNSGDYPLDRFRNTIIGALTACVIHMLLFPPNFIRQAAKSVHQLTEKMTDVMARISHWVQTGLDQNESKNLQQEMEQVLIDLHHANNIVQDALDSLKFNILAKKSKTKLKELKNHIESLSEGYTYLDNLIEIFQNWSYKGTITPSQQNAWAQQITDLIPYFQTAGVPAAQEARSAPNEILTVHISPELESQQFHVSLYQLTVSQIAKFI
jgi:uncharacterized membrane protein YgaE (UPF0421/DUF939 family)